MSVYASVSDEREAVVYYYFVLATWAGVCLVWQFILYQSVDTGLSYFKVGLAGLFWL